MFHLLAPLSLIFSFVLSTSIFNFLRETLIAHTQRRLGPCVVGPLGLFQAVFDGFKLVFKQVVFLLLSSCFPH